MKQKYFSLVIILSLMSFFFVSGCEKKNVDSVGQVHTIDSDILSQPIKVTDPEVLKELQFMRDEKIITFYAYEKMIRMNDIPFLSGNQELYSLCIDIHCNETISRESIQNKMKEIYSQPIKITDPEVLKELQFMRDEQEITSHNYERFIRMDTIPIKYGPEMSRQSYPSCPDPECDALTSRLSIQNDMKEIYSESNVVKDPTIIAELRFMKKRGMIDYGFYKDLLREGAFIKIQSGDIVVEGYPGCYYGSGCDKILSRGYIQNLMKQKLGSSL